MTVRDNYFGNFTHFSTLYEYVSKRKRNLPLGDPVEFKWVEGKVLHLPHFPSRSIIDAIPPVEHV